MLSIGIRCGKGFDRETLKELIKIGARPYEYDVLILGTNQGGMVCAREVCRAKKTALVSWRIPTPGEEEGFDEDESQMSEALELNEKSIEDRTLGILKEENKIEVMEVVSRPKTASRVVTQADDIKDSKRSKWSRKVRRSRQDLKNAITNMAVEGLGYMHEMALINDLRLANRHRPMTWAKMMEQLLDYIIQRNWNILTDFTKEKINIFKGHPVLMDSHTVKVIQSNGEERLITAETIISAVEVHNSFPKDVAGAKEFGVNLDDFFRLSSSPGRTLVVGAGPRGMECAGILAAFRVPVSVVDRSAILEDGDKDIVDMIVEGMIDVGVKFIPNESLVSIQRNQKKDALLAEFVPVQPAPTARKKHFEEFDTILFTTTEKPPPKKFDESALEMEIQRLTGKTYSAEEKSMFNNISVIADQPGDLASLKLEGKLLGQLLSGVRGQQPKLKLIPNIVLTPLEYTYIGTSEIIAKRRLGEECVDIFSGYIRTEDVIPDEDGFKEGFNKCFAKVVAVTRKDMVIGFHLLGKNAVQIMDAILESVEDKLRLSNLHPAIKSLIQFSTQGDE